MTELAELAAHARIVVCCGTGGVGKTTTAAVVALAGARAGRDAVVITIDPAKRLADTLGLADLGDEPRQISPDRWDPGGEARAGGRLSALMLDTRATFDGLVRRHAGDDEQSERILANRFYRNIAGALSGTQEYMAMEKLHELYEEGGYDLIVVDTPPSRHALDFLDAPTRLTRLLDNRIFRFLMMPTRTYLRVASNAVQRFLRTVGKVIGGEVLDDIVAFFRAFEGMEQGFRERAARVNELLAAPSTAFVLITSPRRDAVEEAEFFAARLREFSLGVAALIVNRANPDFSERDPAELKAHADSLRRRKEPAALRLAARYENLADYTELSRRERHELADVGTRIGAAIVVYVPALAHDIVDFAALDTVTTLLFDPEHHEPRTEPNAPDRDGPAPTGH